MQLQVYRSRRKSISKTITNYDKTNISKYSPATHINTQSQIGAKVKTEQQEKAKVNQTRQTS